VQLGGGRKLCLRRKQAEEKSSRILLLYSNFRKYATPPDEKRCIIMEKSFLCSLGIFVGACLA